MDGWVGVDLDGTLAEYHGWDDGRIGRPIEVMVRRIKLWLERGREVKIMTARASFPEMVVPVQDWLEETHSGLYYHMSGIGPMWEVTSQPEPRHGYRTAREAIDAAMRGQAKGGA